MTDHSTVSLLSPNQADLGDFAPKPTAVTEGLKEGSLEIWQHGNTSTGIWAATPGTFTASRIGYSEICIFLSGSCTIQADGEEPIDYAAGDIIVMPSGWTGVWHVHEELRKHYTIITD